MVREEIYRAATQTSAVFHARWLGTLGIRGPDRATWLNGLVTCDVTRVGADQFAYGLALVKVGRVVSDLVVGCRPDELLVAAPRERVGLLRDHFETFHMMEDAEPADRSGELAWVLACGPKSADLLLEHARRCGAFAGSVDLLGTGGAAAALPTGRVEALLGSVSAEAEVALGDEQEWDALRLDLAVPRFGVDFGEKSYPQEAGLEKTAVSFTKGCYLGQEVVCKLETRGQVSKKLVTIRLEGGAPPPVGAEVQAAEGRGIGRVSGSTYSRHFGAPIALATVPREFSEKGSPLAVGGAMGVVVGR